jgi:8-oxo-dGTP pyrophosphatase MutT (NUDIX family)
MSDVQHDNPIKRAAGILLMTRSLPKQFLLLRHPDRWDLPKGHAEVGETLEQTALRETEEETGIPADAIEIDPDFEFQLQYPVTYKRHGDQVFQKEVVYFLAIIESPVTPTLTEHTAFEWFDWKPPHVIQEQTIDPLLSAVAKHLS